MYDPHYEEEREFLLHAEDEVLATLRSSGMRLVDRASPEQLGGLLYCTDVKGLRYCAFFTRKDPGPRRGAGGPASGEAAGTAARAARAR